MYNTASELYNYFLQTHFNYYYDLSDAKKSKMDPKYDLGKLILDEYGYSEWYQEKSDDKKESDQLPPLDHDEEKYYNVPSTPLSKGVKK